MPDLEVTVIMPVYNAEAYIAEAIQSILNQTFRDFKFIIINDGSEDRSEEIITKFKDERIYYVKHGTNLGLVETLNEGLNLVKEGYIIRMDADDIALPERIERQVAFMIANPEIDICGTWFSVINTNTIVRHPVANEECKVNLLHNTVLGHPTTILRHAAIKKSNLKFDKSAIHAEDYKFWADAAVSGLKIANIPTVLLNYRAHEAQISAVKLKEQLETVLNINLWYAQVFFGDLLKPKLDLYTELISGSINTFASFNEIKVLIKQLKAKNRLKNYFDITIFEDFLDNLFKVALFRIYVLCLDCNTGILLKSIFSSDFYINTSIYQKAKFIFRSFQNTLS